MFALLAAIVFFLAAIDVGLGDLGMLAFALCLLSLHFALDWPVIPRRKQ